MHREAPIPYRREIDGLRALAVLTVVLFHAHVPGFEGGFVGVDVFFVISGYLISSIVFTELGAGRFSFAQFWERRARRILPALLVVTLATLVMGWFVLLPDDYAFLGRSAATQSIFASNFLFWRETGGYFGRNSSEAPLLHTWSLSVEEQFYLVFPLAALLVTTRALRFRTWAIAVTIVVSFAVSVWAVAHTSAGFWLLPSRAWELGIGVLLAVEGQRLQRFANAVAAEVASGLGLLLIGCAVAVYDEDTVFPGITAVLPVAGTALVVWANSAGLTVTGRLLAARPAVFIGLISYSMYLWHWPLLVFAAYATAGPLPSAAATGIVVASGFLAYLSWRFVEAPFRHRTLLPARAALLRAAAGGLVLAAAAGMTVDAANGLTDRYQDLARYPFGDCQVSSRTTIKTMRDLCLFGPAGDDPEYLVWGDSHGAHLAHLLREISRETGVTGALFTQGNCPPVSGAVPGHALCSTLKDQVQRTLLASDIRTVVLAGSWAGYETAWARDGLRATVRLLTDHGFDVWVVRDNPRFDFNPRRVLANRLRWGGDTGSLGLSIDDYERRNKPFDELFAELRRDRVEIIDLPAVLCDGEFCPVWKDGLSLYWDANHLSEQGAKYVKPAFATLIDHLSRTKKGSGTISRKF